MYTHLPHFTVQHHLRVLPRLQVYPEILGPMPEATLACWIDLGLSDAEIARYFGLELDLVSRLTWAERRRLTDQKR